MKTVICNCTVHRLVALGANASLAGAHRGRADQCPGLKDLIASGLPGLKGRDGAAVWGQEFLFAVESEKPASVSIDKQPPVAMTSIAGHEVSGTS